MHSGRAQEAVDYLKRVMRLDPFYSPICTYYLGAAYFFLGRYQEALGLIRSAALRLPEHRPSKVLLAAVSAQLGNDQQTRAAAADVRRAEPAFTISKWLKTQRIGEKESERLANALRKAGLPD